MKEGDEQNIEQKIPAEDLSPHEHKQIFALVLFVLVGTALFFGVILTPVADKISFNGTNISNEKMTPQNYSDVPGRNKELLGLVIHKEFGRYYSSVETKMTLYVNIGAREGEWLGDFNKYVIDGIHQKTPKGEELFTYKNDKFPGDANGANIDNWKIARP